jgi:hypothetical protein
MFERNRRTRLFLIIRYALYLYFLELSLLRSTSKALEPFVDRSYYVAIILYWVQEFNPKDVFPNKNKSRITAYIIDETMVQVGYLYWCMALGCSSRTDST